MEKIMSKKSEKESFLGKVPCDFDHNGECLICDCWISECGYSRLLRKDYKYESEEELIEMFKDYLTEEQLKKIKDERD